MSTPIFSRSVSALGAVAGVAFLASAVRADEPVSRDLAAGLTRSLAKAAIPFVSVKDAYSKALGLKDTDVVKIAGGKSIPVPQYLEGIDDLQKRLATQGLSLTAGGENLGKVAETVVPSDVLTPQGKEIVGSIRDLDRSYMPASFTTDEAGAMAKTAAADAVKPSLASLFRQAVTAGSAEAPAFEPILVPSFTPRNDLKTKTHKDWSASYGKKDTFLVNADAFFDLAGNVEVIRAEVNAHANVRIFDSIQQDILKAHGLAEASKLGNVKGDASLWLVGKTVWQDEFDTPALEKSKSFSYPITNVATKIRFMVGPVPMSAKLGVSGNAGVEGQFRASLMHASVALIPKVSGDAYAEVGVDVAVASAGAGGSLKVIEARSALIGLAALHLDEGGKPRLTAKVDSQSSIELLSGRFYAFLEAIIPLPPFKKRWERDIYAWNGIKKDLGHTVAFEKITSPEHIALSGDADPEDSEATDLDTYERRRVEELVKRTGALADSFAASEQQAFASLAAVESGPLADYWKRFGTP